MSYGWHSDQTEYAHGPHETVEECEQEALDLLGDGAEIVICDTVPVVPGYYARRVLDVNNILEQMDESLCDETSFDDPVFEIDDALEKEAAAALDDAIEAWARKYVTAGGHWTTGGEVKRIVVRTVSP